MPGGETGKWLQKNGLLVGKNGNGTVVFLSQITNGKLLALKFETPNTMRGISYPLDTVEHDEIINVLEDVILHALKTSRS